jgi:hypothetical protein
MSQVDLTGEPVTRAAHLTKRPPNGAKGNPLPINPGTDRECYCRECHHRVTQSTDRDKEYGHATDCPHAIGVESR